MERFNIELKKRDCSGIYAVTQRLMTYNSNKIAGSTLTEEQIAFLFDTGSLPPSDYDYRSEDIEEAHGHYLMFNLMMRTLSQEISFYKSFKIKLLRVLSLIIADSLSAV